ncbi:unnamed protein product [Ixodes hexagonus]
MNNVVYGKTTKNGRNRTLIELASDLKNLEDLVALSFNKRKIFANKPTYIGMSVLDLSKTLMNDFHYNIIKNNYKTKHKDSFKDTNSLKYDIQAEDIYII